MTAIVGIFDKEAGRSWIASDSRTSGSPGGSIFADNTPKVRTSDGWVLAAAGHGLSTRRAERLPLAGVDTIDALVAALRSALVEIGMPTKSGADQDFELCIIAGNSSSLWHVSSCLTVTELEPNRPFGTGSGGDYAQGAAWQALRHGLSPPEALTAGIQAAIYYSSQCGGEVQVACSAVIERQGRLIQCEGTTLATVGSFSPPSSRFEVQDFSAGGDT
jgi:ATP-dependent protease HslVU (ClpYQ) peptidase subunit